MVTNGDGSISLKKSNCIFIDFIIYLSEILKCICQNFEMFSSKMLAKIMRWGWVCIIMVVVVTDGEGFDPRASAAPAWYTPYTTVHPHPPSTRRRMQRRRTIFTFLDIYTQHHSLDSYTIKQPGNNQQYHTPSNMHCFSGARKYFLIWTNTFKMFDKYLFVIWTNNCLHLYK